MPSDIIIFDWETYYGLSMSGSISMDASSVSEPSQQPQPYKQVMEGLLYSTWYSLEKIEYNP